MIDTHRKSILKSIVWRVIGIFWLAGITYAVTRSWIQMSITTFIHHAVFLIVFYLHERAWAHSYMRPKLKYAIKAVTYEIILGNLILGIITYFVTGDVKQMTLVTGIYIQSKLVLYFFYDWLWSRK